MTVALDACFRLKRRDVSDVQKDPILGSGWAYFVEDTGYRELLSAYGDQKEVRAHIKHQACLRGLQASYHFHRCRHAPGCQLSTMRTRSSLVVTLPPELEL